MIVFQRELDFEDATEKRNGSMDKDAIAQRLEEIYKRLDAIDADSAEARAATILAVSSQIFCVVAEWITLACFELAIIYKIFVTQ